VPLGRYLRRRFVPQLTQSEIPNRQGAKNAMTEMSYWEGTNESSEDLITWFSGFSVQSLEDCILGDLGVMAVQGFLRISAETAFLKAIGPMPSVCGVGA